jgi:ubiquitin-activating enzyme E1 C
MLKSLQQLLSTQTPLTPADFIPGDETLEMLTSYARVLVIGAGGLGCEILKDLALSGFRYLEVIDLDTIDITNLNRQFLFRKEDVGHYKSEVAARFIMSRVSGVTVKAHTQPIQDFDEDFYKSFHIIVAGLDNVEARRWLNSMIHSIVEFDSQGEVRPESVRPLIDGGTEGFKGQARLIIPYKTACFECTMKMMTPQVNFPLCTIAETPRLPEHCIQYARIIEWEKAFPGKKLDKDSPDDMHWIFNKAEERANRYGIQGVTYMKTMGVVKNIIPAIASTNALISAACVLEALKVATYLGKPVDNYFMYMGQTGLHSQTFPLEKDPECLVCSTRPITLTLKKSSTLKDFLELLKSDSRFKMTNPAVSSNSGPLYMPKPASLEEKLRGRLSLTFAELISSKMYSGESLIVTDATFSKSLTIIISLDE